MKHAKSSTGLRIKKSVALPCEKSLGLGEENTSLLLIQLIACNEYRELGIA